MTGAPGCASRSRGPQPLNGPAKVNRALPLTIACTVHAPPHAAGAVDVTAMVHGPASARTRGDRYDTPAEDAHRPPERSEHRT
jgi:hypothetical protein